MLDRDGRPVLLAVGGDSGSGKTTIARGLYHLFGRENVLSICLDDYHKLDRRQRQQAGVTALNPAANDIALMEEHIWALREGRAVRKPVYDHSTGTFGTPQTVQPKPWIVVRGLFPLFSERLRQAFDVRVWLDPEDELKYHWKVQRDVAQRGYTLEQVIRHIVERQDDLRRYILPQREHADVVVRFYTPPGYFQAIKEGRTNGSLPQLPVKVSLKPSAPAPGVAEMVAAPAVHLTREGAGEQLVLEIDGAIPTEQAQRAQHRLLSLLSLADGPSEELGLFLADGREARRSWTLTLAQLIIACQMAAVRDGLQAAALQPGGRRSRAGAAAEG
mgnify:CR=1 FL=1